MSEPIILPPGGGRAYTIGAMQGVFKADEEAYCASEWSVEPGGAARATAFNVFIPGGGFEASFARWAS